MSYLFWTLISYGLKALLSLRYRIELRGWDQLDPLREKGGILFLPNHPAHMDPLFLNLYLWPKFRMRPLVIEYIYRLPFMKPFIWLVGAIPIPNFENAVNEYKLKRGEESIRKIADGLKERQNFLLYPAGRLKSTGKELLGGASGAHELLKECPNAKVVLIRTTGLWGSSFSRCITGKAPDLFKMLLHGAKVLLKNLLLFTPRRKVVIEFQANPPGMPDRHASRIELNRFLEQWYNRYPDGQGNVQDTEPVQLVSYSFWHREVPEVFQPKVKKNGARVGKISERTRKKIYGEIRRILEKPDLEIALEQNLAFDLGMDSLNMAEFITFLTKNFDVREVRPEDLMTIDSILQLAEGEGPVRRREIEPVAFHWPEEEGRAAPSLALGETIPEVFLNSCERMGSFAACGDNGSGVLHYPKLKRAILVLAEYFRTWEEERVAVLLPASVGASIAVLALQMAGKVPVMLNWTLGSLYLEEMMKIGQAKRIVTSWRFIDRLANVQFGSSLDRLVFLEDVRSALSLKMKVRGALLAKASVKRVLRAMKLTRLEPDHPCVILFTSGTEAAPKGVPLSHKNIITNQRSAMQCIDLNERDVLYGILPPFHSFGCSVGILLPLLGGIKVAFYPDPTDGYALAEGIDRWKITVFCSAPSFLKGLFNAAKEEQLQTIRYFICGAEKAPEELFARVKRMGTGAQLIEGYGITECAPILTISRPHMPPKGVGKLLPGIELITVHPETLELLPPGSDGEICVRGSNVFLGYLGNPRSPFLEIQGKRWYRTGDLGHLESDGTLILSGRLKRFVKIGGELISLGAIEEHLVKQLIQNGRISPDIPAIAVSAYEKEEGRAQIVLFATIEIDKDEANGYLQQAGLSNLIKITQVKKIDEIPLLGAGKTNYRALQDLC